MTQRVESSPMSIAELQETARRMRVHCIRMIANANSGHPGGSLSAADIVAALFFYAMRWDPKDPHWSARDRFILSKGHGCPALYAALAEAGVLAEQELLTFRVIDSRLQGHPSRKDLPYCEASTGSLGQGLSIAIGEALAARNMPERYRVYTLIGDGESQEGQIWEAAAAASHFKADNLTAILDYNRFQLDGAIGQIMSIEPVADKWRAFGWSVKEIDGHDMEQIVEALDWAKTVSDSPQMIIAHTVKGKGVSFMENDNEFHGKAPTPEQTERALAELGAE